MGADVRKLSPAEFPDTLREIPQPPKDLFCRGALPLPDNILLSVVGSRKYSNYGADACQQLIEGLRGYPITIVSGLALGIDALAHRAALKAGLQTIAFPGSGLDPTVLYPASNRQLAEEIIESGGGLLSEHEPKFKATIYSFPERNRLMAGIAKATFVIEAGEKSGTLITARLATEYNRDVLALPGSIFSPNSYGPNWLISRGAIPITKSTDILEALGFDLAQEKANHQEKLFTDLSPAETKIIDLLRIEPLSRDTLIHQTKMIISELNSLLMVMEIKGLIKESGGELHLV